MRRVNHLAGGCLMALGALSCAEALRIRDDWPGARLLPAVLGLALLGAAHLVGRAPDHVVWPDAAGRRRVVFVFGVLALYVAGLPSLGFLPATALFVLVLLRALGRFSWAMTGVVAGAIAVAGQVVFKRWLGMPLPPGLLGP
jgi:Tripartite tricarboxylate transporter TctB family